MRLQIKRYGAAALAGIMAGSLALTGCGSYASSSELRQQAEASLLDQADSGSGSGQGIQVEPDSGTADSGTPDNPGTRDGRGTPDGQDDRTGGPSAETIRVETGLTTAPMPEFESVKDDVYVKTEDGGSVRLRSSCDTGSDANIVTYASSGTRLTRTGKGSEWTRIDYNGTPAYISSAYITTDVPETTAAPAGGVCVDSGEVTLNPSWKYAEFSKINTGAAVLYRSEAGTRKNITICVNAGHGTKGGSSVKTLCHPDGTPKVTGGTTGAGATSAAAVSGGMTFADGTAESKVTLAMARILKDKLLAAGYDVLMIRENDDVQLDNVARTVIANNASDCHIALHWDSTTSNKGAFYMSVPNVESYRNMEPVKSHWQQHNALGESLVAGLKGAGVKIFSGGSMAMDLTQTSYSTVPSVDIELGDKASDHSQATLNTLADGLLAGINQYFGQS
ncbi:putative N-acetylmuramoyl-L-alanine amidase [Clostridiales bacterium 1_7_47FAA]|uniref:N-acetylmuramoyl-L-alanine amidase n=2 Tax=Enterocloster hominis (ex Hitch et al. 2024) TaxID=1917870 RepID=A0ABV1DBL3_9FIRM|nr:putative N-acetylmuramoyl-L-alanine amidase [Clostridiales bacterium 1_7_47FAA]